MKGMLNKVSNGNAKFYLGLGITIILFILAAILGIYGLIFNPNLIPIYFSILTSIIGIYLTQLIRESYSDRSIKKLADVSLSALAEELKRNFCTAEIFAKSLLSTMAWDSVVSSGIALRLKESEFKPLLACYSAVKFYNHDVSKANFGPRKQERVKWFISEALAAIKMESPSIEECCEEILSKWATKKKLDDECDRLT